MTPDPDLSARLAEAGKFATPGKWGQFSPRFMAEAKDAEPKDWDTSHNMSAVHGDERKRLAEWKHADDAAFAEMLVNAYRSGQLITAHAHAEAVKDAVADARLEMINSLKDAIARQEGKGGEGESLWCVIDGERTINEINAQQRMDARIKDAVAKAVEACAVIAEDQSAIFASPEYATGQPLSSLSERFACEAIAADIRSRGVKG